METPQALTPARAETLDGLFRDRIRLTPDRPAYHRYHRGERQWQCFTWAQMQGQTARWQQALAGEKLQPGDRVAILLRNGPEWVMFDQAALSLALVVVPLYTEDRPDNITYVLQDSGAKVLLVQDDHHWSELAAAVEPDELSQLQTVVLLEGHLPERCPAHLGHIHLHLANNWLPPQAEPAEPVAHKGEDLATIVYTSGTTGRPKGVMLSHRNILSIAESAGEALDLLRPHRLLSFLPLSHTFERTCGYYIPIMWGHEVYYARSVQQLADDLQQIRPTAMISVPRIFERIYERLNDQLKKQSPLARGLFHLTVATGWRRFLREQRRGGWDPRLMLWPWLKRHVADKIANKFGGELQLTVCGGAAMQPQVARVFLGLGINLVQGYGMTECSPVISANTHTRNDPSSVGPPLPGVEVRIGDNEELQVRSPGIMLGYWNNHRATSEVIMPDGWLHTGDKARIDNGFIYLTGRIKDILVLSNGEKIPPVDMENAIILDPLFDHALIVGESKPFLAALVVLNPEHWFSLAKQHQLDPFDHDALGNYKLQRTLLQRIGAALHDFPGYAKVRRVRALLEPWTVENGLLTPTLKTKRQVVSQQYAQHINALYSD
jgi:long-chain acyl-CoA synthetase